MPTIRAVAGRRVILGEGAMLPDSTPIPPGEDLSSVGAIVPDSIAVRRAIDSGDAELVPAPAGPAPAKVKANTGSIAGTTP